MSAVPTVVDPLPGLVGFTRSLTAAGLPVTTASAASYLDAVRQIDIADPSQLYWAGRVTLCADKDDLVRYDEAFARWFGTVTAGAEATTEQEQRATIASLGTPPDAGRDEDESTEQDVLRAAASDAEVLRHRDLTELSVAERAHLRELLATLRPEPPTRRGLRTHRARRGRLDPERTFRAMLASGGEPVRLGYARRASTARRVVLLVDVSGSMSAYADALLRFAHVVVRRSKGTTEVFALGTRLTRLSRALRARDPELALLAAGRAVPDWAGGTRLGETLRAFLDRWGQRGAARGAVVVIFSDGWERGETALLTEQVARLHRLAYRVLWVNPHAGHEGYLPVQSGIVAALPYVDKLLAGHSLATLEALMREVRDA